MKRYILSSVASCALLFSSSAAYSEMNSSFVKTNSEYSYKMTDALTNITRKQAFLFENKEKYLQPEELNLGLSFIGIANYQQSNRRNKFGYLMRHPTSNNQVGKTVSEVAVHSVQLQASGAMTPWLAVYSELLYSPEQMFGSGTITSTSRNLVQVRKAYALFGDKQVAPLYLSLGKQDVPFGLMDTVSPFTSSSTWHAFGALAYSAIFGFEMDKIGGSFSAIQGGAQFRAANVPVDGTSTPSQTTNYAADLHVSHSFSDNIDSMLGASYIKGSAYNQEFPVIHFMPGKFNNPAFSVYNKTNLGNFTLQAEFAKTLKKWPGTHNPSPPLNVFKASDVSSLTVGGKYRFDNAIYKKDLDLSLEYSDFVAGPSGSPWRRQSQIVTGVAVYARHNVKIFAEYIHTSGYAPLNNISGDLNGVAGTTHSDKGARSNIFLVGVQASL